MVPVLKEFTIRELRIQVDKQMILISSAESQAEASHASVEEGQIITVVLWRRGRPVLKRKRIYLLQP